MIANRRAAFGFLGRHPRDWSIKTKLMVVNLALSLVPVLVLAYVDGLRLEEALRNGSETMGQTALATVALSLVVMLGLSAVVVSRMVNPIRGLVEDVGRLAMGDLSGTVGEEDLIDSGSNSSSEATQAYQEQQAAINRAKSERIQIISNLAASDLLVSVAAGLRSDPGAIQQLLKETMATNKSFTAVFVLDMDGRCSYSTDSKMIGKMYHFRPYWRRARKGEQYASRVSISVDTRRPMVVYSAPIKYRGDVVGVAALRTDASEISELLLRSRSGAGRNGDEVQQLRASIVETRNQLRLLSIEADKVAAGDLSQNYAIRSDMDAVGIAFNSMIIALRKIVGKVKVAADELSETSVQLSGSTSQTGAAVQQVTAAMQNMASGSQEVSHSSQVTNEAVGHLTESINAITKGAAEQAQQVRASKAAATEMAVQVDRVAKNADNLAIAGERTKGSAEQGAKAVQETVDGMEMIMNVVVQVASRVGELGRLGEKIGAVVETIDDISEQTNLLALNAAIEAARAGEHGRGFAVVADEVRKLAERAQRETKSIAELIKDVQSGTKEAVVAMEAGSSKVQEGSLKAAQAREALDEILMAVSSMSDQVSEIAVAAREMAKGSNSMVEAIENINAVVEKYNASTQEMSHQADLVTSSIESVAAVAEQNNSTTQEVTASAEEMAAQVEEMGAQAEELAAMADTLKQLVARFTIDTASKQS
ncbi:MAG: methyl-accepting chemotaxis protein, partial [Chloroflexota bacterium]